ncbi:MAG: formylglycine-generating enzyme family protein, partial [Desulfomonilaceae bacterium]
MTSISDATVCASENVFGKPVFCYACDNLLKMWGLVKCFCLSVALLLVYPANINAAPGQNPFFKTQAENSNTAQAQIVPQSEQASENIHIKMSDKLILDGEPRNPEQTSKNQNKTADSPNQQPSSDSIAEQIIRAGELALAGDTVRATEIFRQTLKKCQGNDGDSRDCSKWLRPLQGLNMMLENPKKIISKTNSIGMKLVRIPAGEYMMGSPKQELDWLRLTFRKTWREGHKQWFQDETPLHPVRITKPFYMGAYDVTVKEFRDFVNDTKYKTDAEKGEGGMIFSNKENRWVPKKNMKWDSVPWPIADNQPVVFVSWNDAQAFCKWLSHKEKRNYRLPTEAEWEMCCRGGAVWTRYSWGNKLPGDRDTNFGHGNPKLPESLTTVNT